MEKRTEKYAYSLQYCPYDYLYILEKKSTELTHEGYEQKKQDIQGLTYFILTVDRISSGGKGLDRNSPEFGREYDYFSSYFEYSVRLKCGVEDLPCALFHTEGLFGIEPGIKIHMAFENVCPDSDLMVTFTNDFDSPAPISMAVLAENIKNKPEFKF